MQPRSIEHLCCTFFGCAFAPFTARPCLRKRTATSSYGLKSLTDSAEDPGKKGRILVVPFLELWEAEAPAGGYNSGMDEKRLQAQATEIAVRTKVRAFLAGGLAGAVLGGGIMLASALRERGQGWVPTAEPDDFACIGAGLGAAIGASLVAGWIRWRVALAIMGAIASSFAELSACDGTVFLGPPLGALVGGVLGLWVERIRKPAPTRG